MKSAEDNFLKILKSIDSQKIKTFTHEQNNQISEMFCIWNLRHHYKHNIIPDQELVGISGDVLSKDQQEKAEKVHMAFVRENGLVPGRMFAGDAIQLRTLSMKQEIFNHGSWGIVTSIEGEFIVPDNFNKAIFPISPRVCLVFACDTMTIDSQDVAQINRWAVESSTDYYFAKDLSACPIIDSSPQQD